MKYRIIEGANLPFRVLPTIKELGRTRMEVNVKVCNSQRIQIVDIQDCVIFLLIPNFRSRVYLAQKCLLWLLSSRFQYLNRQQKRVSKLHQVEQSIRQLLIA